MATFRYTVMLYNSRGMGGVEIEALVDTGATFTRLPEDLLQRMGYHPTFKESFELGDGWVTEVDVGEAIVGLDGKRGTTRVIFGKLGEEALLGAVTLEEFLFAVDPVHQRLVPVHGLLV